MAYFKSSIATKAPGKGAATLTSSAWIAALLTWMFFFWFPPIPILMTLAAFTAPFWGMAARKGDCPNCGANLLMYKKLGNCPDCGHRLRMDDNRIYDLNAPIEPIVTG